jgi:Ca2+-dependent lipid-binding protein
MLLQRNTKNVLLALIAGLIFGSIVGKVLSYAFPDSPAKMVVFNEVKIGIPQISLNLLIFGITFSFYFSINIFSVIFALFVIYLLIKL